MPDAPFEMPERVDAYRLGQALEEIRACADSDIPDAGGGDHGYQRGVRAGLNMALKLIDLRIGVGS